MEQQAREEAKKFSRLPWERKIFCALAGCEAGPMSWRGKRQAESGQGMTAFILAALREGAEQI